mmetsp:Transcript_57990/g.138069  ORF Transcript_57990/g.138069 Transcript_57990/m.138069 type:complete len:198 (-) Transcript_57990:112-705(-)|eukprot:CAMPEP_0178428106 /NCGR_PEP_ID=MMETSP0689_2-20121128/30099_1 /TAXON_ID=160604 /ORGANISM="Amphidinium massartii, Strain CS-259" /LENGTH=197 /DNA_ID=CAMNT_0020049853 /DNA_START=67 /DNA_END=660 /DNA_ORIENTATION=+
MAAPEEAGSEIAAPAPEPAPLTEDEKETLDDLQELLKLSFPIVPAGPGPAEILPHLLLGSCADAQNLQVLRALGVTHVLNCAGATVRTGAMFYKPSGIEYSEFCSEDCQGYNIMNHYSLLESLADDVKGKGGRLLAHCEAGVNRSGSLCLAYHALSTSTPLLSSAKHCKAKRGRICTNSGFQKQVFDFVRSRGGALS